MSAPKACEKSQLNGVLLPIEEISPELQVREQDYRFIPVMLEQIDMHFEHHQDRYTKQLSKKRIWLCESLAHQQADARHPVYQSYIDTCLVGCIETGSSGFC